jgi:hypothetical protein
MTARRITVDLDEKARTLRERTQTSFIDYFFELEIALDDGIQQIHDAKKVLVKKPKEAEKILDVAIEKFKRIINQARKRQMTDLELRARDLMDKALVFKSDLLTVPRKNPEPKLHALHDRIDSEWEQSDFGKVEVLYDSAYLKVCDARLRRNYDPFETNHLLQESLDIYDRVIRLTTDRVIEEETKKLSTEEEDFQRRNYELLVLGKKSRSNTELLKNKVEDVIRAVIRSGVKEEELRALIELNSEYGLKLRDVLQDTFDKKNVREIIRMIEEIDKLFNAYDEWQTNE